MGGPKEPHVRLGVTPWEGAIFGGVVSPHKV